MIPEVSHVGKLQQLVGLQIPECGLREARIAELRELMDFVAFNAVKTGPPRKD